MKRLAPLLLLSLLGFAACAHDRALDRLDVVEMQTDSPAISAWSASTTDEAVDDGSPARDRR